MPHENGRLTAEELQPTDDDLAEAKRLVEEGWKSTSNKYRMVRRWHPNILDLEDLIHPEMVETAEAQWWLKYAHGPSLRMADVQGLPIEEKTLTVRVFNAFKKLGGEMAR